ncbi:MAG: ABC transporter permease subunit [Oscillospiraceae bacterium]|nr:ABC transporter permease subunit [Oscillospiraceae bacterium]MCL2278681.1 ABC transporter permease subunit [Oscillospiraceae bacterium]
MRKNIQRVGLLFLNIFFIALCFGVLIPILYAFSVSLNAQDSLIGADFRFIPRDFTLEHYRAVLFDYPVLLWLSNTVILAFSSVFISMLVAIPGAYSLSRLRFKGSRPIVKSLIMLHSFPAILSMFALFRLLMPLGLINTRTGLIIIYVGTMSIFGLLNMKGYFDSIPSDIEEAAQIDGANKRQTVMLILLPLAKPAIVVTCMMVLIFVWNEYIFAITFMTGASNYTLSVGLFSLQATEMAGSWPVFAAASITISLPVLVVFFAVQRYMVSGLTAGGVKG